MGGASGAQEITAFAEREVNRAAVHMKVTFAAYLIHFFLEGKLSRKVALWAEFRMKGKIHYETTAIAHSANHAATTNQALRRAIADVLEADLLLNDQEANLKSDLAHGAIIKGITRLLQYAEQEHLGGEINGLAARIRGDLVPTFYP